MELVSVIVPVYNVEDYLDKCVESLIKQTYKNLEIILVDDGSTDTCPGKCDTWENNDSRIRVIHKKNGGLSDARNEGLRLAKGSVIGFVDSDDYVAPEMIERLLQEMNKTNSEIAACSVELFWDNNDKSCYLFEPIDIVMNTLEAQSALLREKILKQPVWYKLYKREIVENLSFEVGKYHEDAYWTYQAIGRAKKMCIIKYVGYYYRQRPESIMGSGYSIKRLDAVEAMVRQVEYLIDTYPELETAARIALCQKCIYHGQMAMLYLDEAMKKEVLQYLGNVHKQYLISYRMIKREKWSHWIWFVMEHFSYVGTCAIRNILKIGF